MTHADLTDRIIGAFYDVYNALGWGFLDRVYHNAFIHELRKRGIAVEPNARIDVFYDGVRVGEYFADMLVDGCVILELKAVERLTAEHDAQLLNYLKATTVSVGLLLNFGPKPQVRRKVFETARAGFKNRNADDADHNPQITADKS
ncbi:MAG: GxxExxY protein [Fimbriiglobus sp.]